MQICYLPFFYYFRELKLRVAEPEQHVDQALIDTLTEESEKLTKARNEIGVKTREIETLKRLIDNVPGRGEIAQYQRRFVELYNLGQ